MKRNRKERQEKIKFFRNCPATDAEYLAIRDGSGQCRQEDKDYIERLWRTTNPYLAMNLPVRAENQFHPEFWEVFLMASLLSNGVKLLTREDRKGQLTPDIGLSDTKIWIEATHRHPRRGGECCCIKPTWG